MKDSLSPKSTKLEDHQRLVKLISEEAEIINKAKGKRKDRHTLILTFLIELQMLSSKELIQ